MPHLSTTYELTQREEMVLQHIIQQYISTACPVGSRSVSKQIELQLSAASIRNIMSDLEEKGFINHPHTSAGRIPTDKGYRFYVDSIFRAEQISESEKELIQNSFEDSLRGEMEKIIRESSHILSKISQQLAVVSAPHFGQSILQKLELISLSSSKLMVILSLASGNVKTLLLEIDAYISLDNLDAITSFLNERVSGLSMREIRETFSERMRGVAPENRALIELFIHSSDRLFAERLSQSRIYVDGMRCVMQQPEFYDPDRLRNIVELAENHNIIIHILDSIGEDDAVIIRIGAELEQESMQDYSLVASAYHVGSMTGTLSIIGPRRMDYPRMIAIVDYLSKHISQ